MKVIKVQTEKPYEVLVARGFLGQVGRLIRTKIDPCRVCIVTDDNVSKLYGAQVENALKEADYDPCTYVFPHGEASKNMQTLAELLGCLADHHLSRSDLIVALGGGVAGDIAGFAASIYMRGIRYVQLPTTLLAAVDASVGGKTAIDLPQGKNLVGAFWQPSMVLCDADTLLTLPPEQVSCGLAEAIKYGILWDRALFDQLAAGGYELEEVIARCVELKAGIVQQDERDTGKRQMLNLGHTVGHAIEQCSGLSVLHGQAVAMGTAVVASAAEKLGLAKQGTCAEILQAYHKLGLADKCGIEAENLPRLRLTTKSAWAGRSPS